jgi:hypothetical protein
VKTSTYHGYVHKAQRHILPALGSKRLRRLRPQHLEALYDAMLNPTDGGHAYAPKTVYEVHLVIRGTLAHAVRRGLLTRNIALVADAPKLRSIPKVEPQSWTAPELRTFLQAAAGHRLFPALWLSAMTGVRRSELLALRWRDLDFDHARLSVNRGLVSVAYELHDSRGKTKRSRRCIGLDPTTITVMRGWQALQAAEFAATGIEHPGCCSPSRTVRRSTPTRSARPSSASLDAPTSRSSACTTCGTRARPSPKWAELQRVHRCVGRANVAAEGTWSQRSRREMCAGRLLLACDLGIRDGCCMGCNDAASSRRPCERTECLMGQSELAGAARLVLVDGVELLRPGPAVFEAMLAGWRRQQESRLLASATVESRDKTVRRFHEFCGEFPWRWQPGGCGGLDGVAAIDGPVPVDDPGVSERVGDVHGLPVRCPLRVGGRVRGSLR